MLLNLSKSFLDWNTLIETEATDPFDKRSQQLSKAAKGSFLIDKRSNI